MTTPFARVIRNASALAAMFLLVARLADAQTISGRIVAKTDSAPIAAAIVTLIDATGRAVAAKLADDSGAFSFAAPQPGRYSVRVERVGVGSVASSPFLVRQDEMVRLAIAMSGDGVSLRAVVVTADRRCLIRPQEGIAAAQLWNEARKALTATQLTQLAQAAARSRHDPHRFVVRWRTIQRELEPKTLAVLKSDEFTQESETVKGFVSADPEILARDGYMTGDPDSGSTFFAPDADVLLSDRFLDSHCLRLQAPDGSRRDNLIGLAFEPVGLTNDRRSRRVDVRGILWLDRASAELRYMEYQYVNLPREQTTRHAGGLLEFRPLPDGRWIVWRWYIRMPALVRHRSVLNSQLTEWHTEIAKILENGAEVLEVMPAGTGLATAASRLHGTVTDSLSGSPMVGVRVFLSGTSFAAVTGNDGSYVIQSIPPGRYSASIIAPRLDSLLLDAPRREFTLSGGEDKQIDLALPSLRTLSSQLCAQAMPDSMLMILGVVRDSGAAASDVVVRAEWMEYSMPTADRLREQSMWSETATGKAGRYSLCGLPSARQITVRAARAGTSVASPQRPAARGEVRRVDLVLRKPQ